MTFDANNLSEEQRLGVLQGDLSLADVAATPQATPTAELAAALPPGRDEKGKCTSVTAGDLTSMLSVVMNRQQGFIRWNLMSQEVEVNGSPLSAHQQECIYIPIQQRGYLARKSDAKDALAMAAQADAYNPVRDYLDSVRSGPKVDITRLASFYLRPADLESSPDEPTIYDRMLFKTLVGAVKRAYEPGCLFDTCTVLKGAQGIRKTTFWRKLFGKHFAIFRGRIGDKDALLTLHANWGLELGELDGITSMTHAGHLKNFLSTECDHFRPPYAAKAVPCPRPSIFVGSCNRGDFLYDDTGERRWWIIPCEIPDGKKIEIETLEPDVDAIWAAAVAAYEDGVLTYLSETDEVENEELNRDYTADNPAEGSVHAFLVSKAGVKHIEPDELIAFVADRMSGSMTTYQLQRLVKDAMTRAGWTLRRGSAAEFGPHRPRKWFRT